MNTNLATRCLALSLFMWVSLPRSLAAELLAVVPRPFADSASYLAWGRELFGIYCASCHGADGTGNGPASASLKTGPPDLTQISKKHDGKFPQMEVVGFIDGETPLAAHGSREMPVWGRVFRPRRSGSSLGSPEIYAMTDYLESIQKKTAQELGVGKKP